VESGLSKSNDSDKGYHKVTRQLHPDDKCPSGSSSDPSVIPEGKTGTVHLDDKGVHPPRLRYARSIAALSKEPSLPKRKPPAHAVGNRSSDPYQWGVVQWGCSSFSVEEDTDSTSL
jgi:hypothetical protein